VKMARITWEFFARRRKTTPSALVGQGVVRDYDSFLSHCRNLGVIPLSRPDFDAQFGPHLADLPPPPVVTPEVKVETRVEEPLEPEFLEATILLSGVDDMPPAPLAEEPKKKGFKRSRSRANKKTD
jgi:hypothetical protein